MTALSKIRDQMQSLLRRVSLRPSREQTGMTMVELMVAISVLAIIMSGLALSVGIDYKAIQLARSRQVAESVANRRLEELRDVDYPSMALSSAPVHDTDPTNPDYFVSGDGATYDVNGAGQDETLIVAAGTGPVVHIESPVTVGTTVVDVYQYVTWVDDPDIAGAENLKRLTVVVQYHTIPVVGGARMLRESVILTNGTVNIGGDTIDPDSTTTTTSSSSTTTTTTAGTCGGFSIAGSSGATVGYTATTTVTVTMDMSGCGFGSEILNFSNDGGTTWGPDITWTPSNTTAAWTLTAGEGLKDVSGRARHSWSSPWSLATQSIILDTTAPTTPGSISRTASCAGSSRTVVLTWTASTDTYLVGYHVYRSTDGATWQLVTSTSGLTASNTHSKTLTSTRFYVKGYDSAGNESNASSTISLAKNQCS